jgi:hypothetical protein
MAEFGFVQHDGAVNVADGVFPRWVRASFSNVMLEMSW